MTDALSPRVIDYLERAVSCVRGGLLVTGWHWAEKARAELDAMTDGQPASWLVEVDPVEDFDVDVPDVDFEAFDLDLDLVGDDGRCVVCGAERKGT